MLAVRGLTIIVADTSPDCFRAALSIASAHAALGGNARLFLHGLAVPLAQSPAEDDERYVAAGQGKLADLLDTALDLGVRVILCQSGMELAGMTADACDPRLNQGGLVNLMQTLGDDRLLAM
jgi:predicted peroxiredoxin